MNIISDDVDKDYDLCRLVHAGYEHIELVTKDVASLMVGDYIFRVSHYCPDKVHLFAPVGTYPRKKSKVGRPLKHNKKVAVNIKLPPELIDWMNQRPESKAVLIQNAMREFYQIDLFGDSN